VTDVLNDLFSGYDRRVRPHYEDGHPVVVTVGFTLLSIDTINVIDMDFSMDMFLRQEWYDQRLDHKTNETVFLSNHVMDKIWLPDSYFVNAKDAKFHTVTTDNKMIMLSPGGRVQYNARVSVRLYCDMELRDFPMDTQYCPVVFESYGYSDRHITFVWELGMNTIPERLKILPQYNLKEVALSTTYNVYVVGNWSGVKATFAFERTYSYFIYHVYAPSAIIVVISWIGFVLPRDKPPARITLGVTSVLTIVTVLNMLSNTVAKVNYVKRIDEYLIGCFLFVFCSLIEYSFVLLLAYRMKKYQRHSGKKDKKLLETKVRMLIV
ncbi:predicted protein, partial [Nematostella vectensis]